MEQLVSMGFSPETAAKALEATGGNSTLKATEWILSQESSPIVIPSFSSSPETNPSKLQPKLDRFFHFKSENEDGVSIKRPRLRLPPQQPLAERMRPLTVSEVVGQEHLLSQKGILTTSIQCNRLPSILLWGPPGTGKTSIARAIVNSTSDMLYRFVHMSAVTSGVKDLRDAVDDARKMRLKNGKTTVLFVDEVHRFNKSQQDSFLPVIEDGSIVFLGATTENPSFHLITPLLSRCRLLTLSPLKPSHLVTILNRAITHSDRGLVKSLGVGVEVSEDAVRFLSENCDGDARVALNALEISATSAVARVKADQNSSTEEVKVSLDDAKEALQCKHLAYDKAGEEHYNLISAFHKSMRGNDANASIYWLSRMLEGGEQPLYIARRLIRFASEDVGLADPLALNQAVACYQACHFLGMPECNVILAQCAAYLALAPKSIAVYRAIGAAQKVVRDSVGQNEGVPLHLRNAPTRLMKEIGYGKGYIYTPENPSSTQAYLPPSLEGYRFLDWPPSKSSSDERETI
ncbi:Replication-associated recombination protein A [Euphorbia peplus]|nr:Replication-associated recombination protein A [Euphorbia peplus]